MGFGLAWLSLVFFLSLQLSSSTKHHTEKHPLLHSLHTGKKPSQHTGGETEAHFQPQPLFQLRSQTPLFHQPGPYVHDTEGYFFPYGHLTWKQSPTAHSAIDVPCRKQGHVCWVPPVQGLVPTSSTLCRMDTCSMFSPSKGRGWLQGTS